MNFRSVGKAALCLLFLCSTLSVSAQTTSSSSMKANPWAPQVPYDLGDVGVEQPVRWGVDTAWRWSWWPLRATNHMQECVSLGRVTLDPRVDQSYSSLNDTQKSGLDEQLGWLKKSGVKDLYLLSGNVTGQDWQTAWRAPFINDIALAVQYLQSKGYNVTCISPFNEPDYSANYAPAIDEQAYVARQMRQNATLKNIDVCGPSTLNPDYGLSWWNLFGGSYQVGNTHQLAGSSDSFANFYAAVQRDGKKSTGDEMHNINDALVGMNYGMSEGIWWSDYGGYTRAELGRASNDGVRVGWMENRSTFTSAAVFRRKSQQLAEVFMGSSERQAGNASYSFVSQDRLVYYDGEGPTYDFTAGTPGGTGYQNGQTNAETVVELTYGEDVPVGPIRGGTFKLVNKATQKLLTATSLSNGSTVNQQTELKNRYQSWVITPLAERAASDFAYMTIMNAQTTSGQFYLDGVKWGADNGAGVDVYQGAGNECERWHLRYMGDGYYVLTNHDSGLSLEGSSNNSDRNTTAVVQWARTGSDRQLWRLVPADAKVEFDAPAAPAGLQATAQSGSVLLTWDANTEDDLLGYMIYRYNTQAGLWDCIARGVKGETFLDNTLPKGQAQQYRIRAVDAAWNVSEPSSAVDCTTLGEKAIIGEWHLTSTLNDITENNLHAISTGVTFASDSKHQAAKFDGTDDYIKLPYHVANLRQMTFSAWVKNSNTTAWQRIFDFGRNTENYVMLTNSDGNRMRFEICKDGVKQGLNATKRLGQNVWTLVTVTMDDERVCIYLNGELNASSTSITFRPADIYPILSYVGRSMFDADPFFSGSMTDILLYNYALSADEVRALMYHEQLAGAIELLRKPMYKPTKQALQKSYDEVQAAILASETDKISSLFTVLNAAEAEARLSVAAYEPLVQTLDRSASLAVEHPQSDAAARSAYKNSYDQMYADCMEGVFPDADVSSQVIAVESFTNQYLMTDAVATATESKPVDITFLMQNADFASNTLEGWTLTTNEASYGGDFYEGCFEVYNHTFDLAHLLYGMPSGIYTLAVQGFYRCGARENIPEATDANAVVYVCDQEEPLNLITRGANGRTGEGSWYSYATNRSVPDDMASAHAAFTALNRYRPSASYNTVQGTYDASLNAPLRVGLRKSVAVPSDWTIVNTFTLRYLGDPTATGISAMENEELRMKNPEAVYDLTGRRVGEMKNEELRMKNESNSYSSFGGEADIHHSTLSPGLYIIGGRKVLLK